MKKLQNSILALVIMVIAACGSTNQSENNVLSAIDFSTKMSESGAVLLDVRTPAEYAMGHLVGAQNMDVNNADFAEKAATLTKNQTTLVYCKSGARSKKAADLLAALGVQVYDLDGGIINWTSNNMPVESTQKEDKESFTMARYTKETTENTLVLVDFHATWCGPCKMMAPHIEAMKAKYGDKLTVLKVDTDKSSEVAQHFKINAIPLVKLYKDGKEVYDRTGYHSAEELEALLAKSI